MSQRSSSVQAFVDAASAAFERHASDARSRRSIQQAFALMRQTGTTHSDHGHRLPACAWLPGALATAGANPDFRRLTDRFAAIEPLLIWSRRKDAGGTASRNFADGHANAMIIGPGGLEERKDVWLGVSLLAPDVRYPDHNHAPEEVYLVLSKGEFQHGHSAWFSPGIGGSFYNEPGIRHAMRSLDVPLFAFWALVAAAK